MAANNGTSNSVSGKAHGENSAGFEESFARLQEVVAKLSEGNLTLEEALSAYEEGMGLADRCSRMLEEAELRVKQVSERAMRAGATSLEDLQEAESGPSRQGEQILVPLEIESYEANIYFDEAPAGKEARPNEEPPSPEKQAPPAQRSTLKPLLEDLDPLFDDED
jgi:exodeoxyribonuclease VII small subunit